MNESGEEEVIPNEIQVLSPQHIREVFSHKRFLNTPQSFEYQILKQKSFSSTIKILQTTLHNGEKRKIIWKNQSFFVLENDYIIRKGVPPDLDYTPEDLIYGKLHLNKNKKKFPRPITICQNWKIFHPDYDNEFSGVTSDVDKKLIEFRDKQFRKFFQFREEIELDKSAIFFEGKKCFFFGNDFSIDHSSEGEDSDHAAPGFGNGVLVGLNQKKIIFKTKKFLFEKIRFETENFLEYLKNFAKNSSKKKRTGGDEISYFQSCFMYTISDICIIDRRVKVRSHYCWMDFINFKKFMKENVKFYKEDMMPKENSFSIVNIFASKGKINGEYLFVFLINSTVNIEDFEEGIRSGIILLKLSNKNNEDCSVELMDKIYLFNQGFRNWEFFEEKNLLEKRIQEPFILSGMIERVNRDVYEEDSFLKFYFDFEKEKFFRVDELSNWRQRRARVDDEGKLMIVYDDAGENLFEIEFFVN